MVIKIKGLLAQYKLTPLSHNKNTEIVLSHLATVWRKPYAHNKGLKKKKML